MKFTPKTEEEVSNLLPEGEYMLVVTEAEDRVSKSGAEMIYLKLETVDEDPFSKIIFDYLLEAMAYKLRHFCEATGLLPKYDEGSLVAADCIGRKVLAKVFIDSKDPAYAPKNAIRDYVIDKTKRAEASGKPPGIGAPKDAGTEEFFNDDIPF